MSWATLRKQCESEEKMYRRLSNMSEGLRRLHNQATWSYLKGSLIKPPQALRHIGQPTVHFLSARSAANSPSRLPPTPRYIAVYAGVRPRRFSGAARHHTRPGAVVGRGPP